MCYYFFICYRFLKNKSLLTPLYADCQTSIKLYMIKMIKKIFNSLAKRGEKIKKIQYQSGFSLTKDNSSFSSCLGLNLLFVCQSYNLN